MPSPSPTRRRLVALAGLSGPCAAAALLLAAAGPTAAPGAGAPAAAGLVAVIDAESGGVRAATAAEIGALDADLAAKLSRSTEGLTVVRHPNGMESIDLQERFQNVSVVTMGADGRRTFACCADPAHAAAHLHGAVPASGVPEVK